MRCPDEMCDNNGNSIDHHAGCDAATRTCADECPVTIRCKWCYENSESDMNLRKMTSKQRRQFIMSDADLRKWQNKC